MGFNLHKDLTSTGWHSSIITTYSVDPAFYDMYIERRLRTYGVKNNILMADASMLKMALNELPEAFTSAGLRYAVVPVSVTGAFHPKVHLRIGENKARLLIGSANATAAGWGRNREVVTKLDWKWLEQDAVDNTAMGQLLVKAYNYLERWLEKVPGEVIKYKLQMIERQAPWLLELDISKRPVTLSDGSAADLLCDSGGDSPSMLKQFSELVMQEKVRRLVVVSPYWDTNLRGFFDLRAALGNPTAIVALNPRTNSFPLNVLHKDDRLKFVAIEDSGAFLHAKIFIVQTSKADHVLFGSANCSDDAIGYLKGSSRNAEVSVYRRLTPGEALEKLGIDISKEILRTQIQSPLSTTKTSNGKVKVAPGGIIELREQALTWWPPESVSADGALIELGGITITPHKVAGGSWQAEFILKQVFPLIATVHYSNGALSDPVLVHSELPLRKAAPGQIDCKLNDALNKARGPDGDLIELAAQAHLIFEPRQRNIKLGGGHKGKRKTENKKVVKYKSEDEFLNAMLPGTGKSGRTDENDPGLVDLLAIINRNIAGSHTGTDTDNTESEMGLLAGDTEDDVENDPEDDNEEQQVSPQQVLPRTNNKTASVFTNTDFLHRRKQLIKALDLFDEHLDLLKDEPSLITGRLAIQTMFVFRLMRYGVSQIHKVEDDKERTLMVVMPSGGFNSERWYSFVMRTAWTLKKIWTGVPPLWQIRLDARQNELPDDIYGFIVVSRWAVVRAYLEAKSVDARCPDGKVSKLTSSFDKLAREVCAASQTLGKVDAVQERKTISELDSDVGCTPGQTEELLCCLREFSAKGGVFSSQDKEAESLLST